MAIALKQVERDIPHYTKPKMKLTVTPELAEEMYGNDRNTLRPKFPVGQKSFHLISMPMEEFLADYVPFIEKNPEIQRLQTQSALDGEKKSTKSQGIIECIFDGYDIGVISVRAYSNDEKILYSIKMELTKEMQDGSHRVRSFEWFTAGDFVIHPDFKSSIPQFENTDFNDLGKFSTSWPQELIDYFNKYIVILKVYENMTEEESVVQFNYTNKNSQSNRQMTRNGHGRKNIARVHRDPVRGGGILWDNDKPHDLFNYVTKKNGKKVFKYLNYDNDKLDMEEQVAQIGYRYWLIYTTNKGGEFLGVVSQDQLDYMYEQNHDDMMIDKLRVAIKKHLNFIFKMADSLEKTNIKLKKGDFHFYSRLYFMMLDHTKGKEPKLRNSTKFHDDIKDAKDRISKINVTYPGDKEKRIVAVVFEKYHNKHDDIVRIHATRDILLQQINFEHHIKNFDSVRVYPRHKLEVKWRNNNNECSELGVEISFPECQGGHIISVYNEGKTTDENIDPMHRIVNNHMGKINRDEWRKFNMLDGKIISQSFYDHINRFASDDLKKKLEKAGIWNQSNVK